MRILVLSNFYPPHGSDFNAQYCQKITEALHGRGHEICVLTSGHREAGSAEPESPPYQLVRSLTLNEKVEGRKERICTLATRECANSRVLLRQIGSFYPDLVYVWSLQGLSKSLIMSLQRLAIPTVFAVFSPWLTHDLKVSAWTKWWNPTAYSLPASLARLYWTMRGKRREWDQDAPTNPESHLKFQRLHFCSRRLRDLALAAGHDVAHGQIIPYPVDPSVYHGPVKTAQTPMRRLLCILQKDQEGELHPLLEALEAVNGQFKGELHVYSLEASEISQDEVLKSYIELHRLRISFHQACLEDLPAIYRDHDVFISMVEAKEASPCLLLGAMASGLPVIAAAKSTGTELLRHGSTALTFPQGDFMQLARCLTQMEEEPNWRVQMAETAQRRVKEYHLPLIVERVESYLVESVNSWEAPYFPHYSEKEIHVPTAVFSPLAPLNK